MYILTKQIFVVYVYKISCTKIFGYLLKVLRKSDKI